MNKIMDIAIPLLVFAFMLVTWLIARATLLRYSESQMRRENLRDRLTRTLIQRLGETEDYQFMEDPRMTIVSDEEHHRLDLVSGISARVSQMSTEQLEALARDIGVKV